MDKGKILTDRHSNCLNTVRLIAAFQVLIGHAQVHFKIDFLPDFIVPLLNLFQGVPIFFILSGFLIWDSIARTKDLKTFCKKRIFRLYPELWCGVAVNFVLITCLFFQNIQWGSFLVFQITQSTVLQFWTPDFLRAYGNGTPNGSLWTICVMVQAYLVMWFLYRLLHKKKAIWWVVANFGCILLSFTPAIAEKILPTIIYKLYRQTFVPYLWLFVTGMTLCEFFDCWILWLKKYWYLFAGVALVISYTGMDIIGTYGVFRNLLMAAAIIGFAYRYPQFSLKNDYSYGIYIYHMILINLLLHFGLSGAYWNVIVTMVGSVLMAMLSYHTIGAFSRNKRKLL